MFCTVFKWNLIGVEENDDFARSCKTSFFSAEKSESGRLPYFGKSTDFNNEKISYNNQEIEMRENDVDKRKSKVDYKTTTAYFKNATQRRK